MNECTIYLEQMVLGDGMSPNTDHTRAIRLKFLSPTWVEQLDAEYGREIASNGGFVEFHIRMEGQPRPRWWERVTRFFGCKSVKDN